MLNKWITSKNHLARCTNILEDTDLYFMDEHKINDMVGMETAIKVLQIFKDKYFKVSKIHITLKIA
jgi:hypothetical protein